MEAWPDDQQLLHPFAPADAAMTREGGSAGLSAGNPEGDEAGTRPHWHHGRPVSRDRQAGG